jgi:zeaxanthin glucosyltransferase
MTALARRLQSRGNEVVFFGVPDVEPFARAAGLDFVPYGSIDKVYSSVAQLHGFEVVRHSRPIAWVSALDDPSSGSRSPPL